VLRLHDPIDADYFVDSSRFIAGFWRAQNSQLWAYWPFRQPGERPATTLIDGSRSSRRWGLLPCVLTVLMAAGMEQRW